MVSVDISTRIRARPVPAADQLPGDLHPVLRRVLAARSVEQHQLNPTLAGLIPVSALPGNAAAVERLVQARKRQEHVLVLGDFDADGATATALVVSCLKAFGFTTVSYLVPDRFRFGYGLSPAIADLAAERQPGLIVTVDNGITSLEGVQRARALGIDVLVTDHHLAGPVLPATTLLVNPNLPGSSFGSPALCGVGVAFYVMAALARQLETEGLVAGADARGAVTDTLDLVATGTVADLVPLDYNNRILVSEGLRRIRAGRIRPGLRALFAVAGRDPARAQAVDLGFAIAPRLNAAGRLADMSVGIECLLAREGEAEARAAQLDALNLERRELQAQMEAEATDLLVGLPTVATGGELALCLFDSRWHAGVVGLVASRVRERTGRPVVAFAKAGEDGWLRGSARSVAGVHVRDAIAMAVEQLPGLDIRFGGHAMAAGITLPEAALDRFRAAFAAAVVGHRDLLAAPEVRWTDGSLGPGELCLELADVLAAAGPWGQSFPEPCFDNRLKVLEQRVVGQRHLRLTLQHPDGGRPLPAIAFGRDPLPAAGWDVEARFVYRLDVNVYRSSRTAQLVVEHVEYD